MTAVEPPVEPPVGAPTGGRLARLWAEVAFPVEAWLVVALALVAVVWASNTWFDPNVHYPVGPTPFPGDGVLGGWFRFDGGWYEYIAVNGYFYVDPTVQSPVAFFPAYPLLMRALAVVVRDEIVAGMIVTAVCGLGMTVLLHRWTIERFGESVARWTVLTVVVYPWAWYLVGAVYADALFLVAVLGAFVLLEHDHPVLAGLAGAVATATRPVGLAVVIGLVAVTLHRRGGLRSWRELRPADAGVLLSLAGIGAYVGYLWARWSEPLAFAEVQQAPGWDQPSEPSTWFKVAFFDKVGRLPYFVKDALSDTTNSTARPWYDSVYSSGILLQAVAIVVALGLAVIVWRRMGWGYGVYCVAVLGIPLLGTKDFQGVGRYVLAAFPCFAVAGQLLEDHPRARWVVLPASAVLLVVLTSFYGRGYYVS